MAIRILYEDRDILVVHKPAGLATQTARVGQQDTVSELKNYLCRGKTVSEPYLGVIHRLDQPVEGLLVFAKHKSAAASLAGQLQGEGAFCKQYLAVLCGIPVQWESVLTNYLCKEAIMMGKKKEYRAVVVSELQKIPEARRASLHYCIRQVQEEQGLALAEIHIETGRFHQIRAQMAHAGLPLLGDEKYGGERARPKGQASDIRHVALCAYRLGFLHPASKQEMDFRIRPENQAFSCFSQL